MRAHSENAMVLARALASHPKVQKVYYPGLASHPQHALAAQQQSGYGGVVSFEVQGGQQGAWRVLDSTRIFSITANLGDAKSTITHPATTTHWRLSEDERLATGITPGFVRISVGLEDPDDLWQDLQRGLALLA
jgi:O-succinylhomoserine sulfhydrylase